MAAKEESVILKYLKKNPGSEALDISFGTDIDEDVVKETLQQLLGKQQVAEKVDEAGRSSWTIATPPPPPPKPVAPKPERAAPVAVEREPVVADDPVSDDEPAAKGGTGKGFVIFIALLFSLISAGASIFVSKSVIASAKEEMSNKASSVRDSAIGEVNNLRNELGNLKTEVAKLKPAAAEEPAKEEPKAKGKAKPAPKGKKKGH